MDTALSAPEFPRPIHFAEDAPPWTDPSASGSDRAWSTPLSQPTSAATYERLANAFGLRFTIPGMPVITQGDEIGLAGAGFPDNQRPMPFSGLTPAQTQLRERLRTLALVRGAHPALRHGALTRIGTTDSVIAYSMTDDHETLYVAINRSDTQQAMPGFPAIAYSDLVAGGAQSGPTITLPARSMLILSPAP